MRIIKKELGDKSNLWKDGRSLNKDYRNWQKNRFNVLKRIKISDSAIHTFQEWMLLKKLCNYSCSCCGKTEIELNKKLTEDHIIPLSAGGSDSIENIQPLCSFCNNTKHVKIIKY